MVSHVAPGRLERFEIRPSFHERSIKCRRFYSDILLKMRAQEGKSAPRRREGEPGEGKGFR